MSGFIFEIGDFGADVMGEHNDFIGNKSKYYKHC